jgi:hypothetical protein
VLRRALAVDAAARFESVDALRIAIQNVQRTRAVAGAAELAEWVQARRRDTAR